MRAAPAPGEQDSPGYANVVTRLLFDDGCDTSKDGTAAAVTAGYASNSSNESAGKLRAGRSTKLSKSAKSSKSGSRSNRSSSRRRKEAKWEDIPCKHCRKFKRHNVHPGVPSAKCFLNKKYKGFCPRYACKKMDLPYKSRGNFSADMGGYTEAGGYSSGDGDTTSDGE